MASAAAVAELQMRSSVDAALAAVRQVLDATRTPQYAADVPHAYNDKYAIVERATQAALVAQLNILCDGFGLSGERLRALQTQAQQGRQTITLRFDVASTCTFLKTTKREERSKRTLLMSTVKTTYHHHWDFQATWCVSAYVGAFKSPDAAMALRRRTGHDEVVTEANNIDSKAFKHARESLTQPEQSEWPLPAQSSADPLDVDLTWLLKFIWIDASNSDEPDEDLPVAKVADSSKKSEKQEVEQLEASAGGAANAAAAAAAEDPNSDWSSNGFSGPQLTCEMNHLLSPGTAKSRACDVCDLGIPDGDRLHACSICEFDMCLACASRAAPDESASPAPTVDAPPALIRFAIDRTRRECHTPSNNPDILEVLQGGAALSKWASTITAALAQVYRSYASHGNFQIANCLSRSSVARDVFNPIPVFAMLEDRGPVAQRLLPAALPEDGDSHVSPANTPSFLAGNQLEQDASSVQLSAVDFDQLLQHHRAQLRAKLVSLSSELPAGHFFAELGQAPSAATPIELGLRTTAEGAVRVCGHASLDIWAAHGMVVDAVEAMLRRQLVEAIGKELTPTDFAAYMVHHRRTLFKPDFTPQAFSYPIRRPDHYPEGILSLETDGDHQPIATTVRYRQVGHAMRLPLGAGMEVQLQGEHFVHAQVLHQFSCNPGQGPAAPPRPQPVLRCPAMHSLSTEQSVDVKLKRCKMCSQLLRSTAQCHSCSLCKWAVCQNCMSRCSQPRPASGRAEHVAAASAAAPPSSLIARARQFSSFILLLGSLNAGDEFNATHALILKNKDEVKIPLILTTIPTPKQFRKKVSSLSPEQQAFAKAYRGMQLSGTLFAVATVQIKPNLERLLNLPPRALTKEVQMCQDLMKLFIEYQIPSDLLSFSAQDDSVIDDETLVPAHERVSAVKRHIQALDDMIAGQKKEELHDMKQRATKGAVNLSRFDDSSDSSLSSSYDENSLHSSSDESSSSDSDSGASMNALRNSVRDRRRQLRASSDNSDDDSDDSDSRGSGTASGSDGKKSNDQDGHNAEQTDAGDASVNELTVVPAKPEFVDYTRLPHELNAAFDKQDLFDCLRPTKMAAGETWSKTEQDGLLSKPKSRSLSQESQRNERERAFDLLDALSRSGSLPLVGCSLHVMVAATHCFDRGLMATLVRDNVDPIARAEHSELIMANALFGPELDTAAIVREEVLPRVKENCFQLFPDHGSDPSE